MDGTAGGTGVPPTQEPSGDGRRAKGQRRRAQIIEATLAVVLRDGAAGVSHRTVAREAGIPTSLTTYHFATLDELLVATLASVADTYTARIREITDTYDDKVLGLAELIAESTGEGRERALAERELSTLAARRPALRPLARRWRDFAADLARTRTSDPRAIQALVACADGLCAATLLDDAAVDVAEIHAILNHVLEPRTAP